MLVHGIRTRAPWQEAIRDVLEAEGFTVVLTNYDYFDIFRFVAPFIILRRKPENILAKQLRIIRSIHPSAQISIIAHSFGTYIVSNTLRDDPISKFNRMIYCGSVVRYDFSFESLSSRFTGPILNEVGTADVWPAMAESISIGYGSTGSFGFHTPLVHDRSHRNFRHSDFLTAKFCKDNWLPFLKSGTINPPTAGDSSARVRWPTIIWFLHLKYPLYFAIIAGLLYAWANGWFPYQLESTRKLKNADIVTKRVDGNRRKLIDRYADLDDENRKLKRQLKNLQSPPGPSEPTTSTPEPDREELAEFIKLFADAYNSNDPHRVPFASKVNYYTDGEISRAEAQRDLGYFLSEFPNHSYFPRLGTGGQNITITKPPGSQDQWRVIFVFDYKHVGKTRTISGHAKFSLDLRPRGPTWEITGIRIREDDRQTVYN